jgi:PBP1b-binding outer membrane lipoprotein LpoB
MKSILSLLGLTLVLTGCVKLRTEPIRVEPIVITMNVNLRIVQELNEFFDELDAQSTVLNPPIHETE